VDRDVSLGLPPEARQEPRDAHRPARVELLLMDRETAALLRAGRLNLG
jgi:hypothetical protein